jgi:hypothetical protein
MHGLCDSDLGISSDWPVKPSASAGEGISLRYFQTSDVRANRRRSELWCPSVAPMTRCALASGGENEWPRAGKPRPHKSKNGNEVGAAISRTIGGCGLYTWKRSLFQLIQRVSLFPPPRSDLLIGNALLGALSASPRCGDPLLPRLRRGATLYLAPTGLRWFLISSSGVARGCHEVPRWGTGTPPFPHSRNSFHAKFARMPAGACGHSRF